MYNRAVKEKIKNKLRDSKRTSQSKSKVKNDEIKDKKINEDAELEEYYLGKDREDERKKQAYVISFSHKILNST